MFQHKIPISDPGSQGRVRSAQGSRVQRVNVISVEISLLATSVAYVVSEVRDRVEFAVIIMQQL